MATNPTLPLVRQAVAEVIEAGDDLTVKAVRARLERDVSAYKLLLKSLDPVRAIKALTDSAIDTALREYIAYPTERGFVHIDSTRDDVDPAKLRLAREYRREQIEDMERSLAAITDRIAELSLLNATETLEPIEVPEAQRA